MNGNPPANGSRSSDPYSKLRLVALIAAIVGVILLAALAFVLSYGGIHALARQAGMSASMARLFPLIFDAMLVVSCVAVLLLRGAGWWRRGYAWLITIILLAAVAAGDAAHAAGTHLPRRPAAITAAVLPWVLLLLAFSLLLAMLRQFRYHRAVVARQQTAAKVKPAVTLSRSEAPAAGRTRLDDLFNRDRATAPATGSETAAGSTQLASAPAATRTDATRVEAASAEAARPSGAGSAAPQNGAADTKSPESARRSITQPIAATGATKPAATAFDAADKPANVQPSAPASGAAAAATGAAAALVSHRGQRPADEASAGQPPAGQASPTPDIQPVTGAPDAQPVAAVQDRLPAITQDQPAAQTPATTTPADEAVATEAPAGQAPATGAPAGQGGAGQADEPKPAARPPADERPADERPTDETPTDQTPADQPLTDETPAAPPAGPASAAIRVPPQPRRTPVPAPSPHFDRLRSTPTPPDEDNDTDS